MMEQKSGTLANTDRLKDRSFTNSSCLAANYFLLKLQCLALQFDYYQRQKIPDIRRDKHPHHEATISDYFNIIAIRLIRLPYGESLVFVASCSEKSQLAASTMAESELQVENNLHR